ncbi:MAG: TMEM175 family protein [Bacteroidota bacterium]|nr:TMEM175 family protein [Bacteroidota bacterium]MDQ6890690.1 TMEM175 family protein [Bacteroidota bacterium]
MMTPALSEHKKKFQLERMILFSDAVFAIAITLLVIDLKIPEIPEPVTELRVINAFLGLIPKLIGFLLSFFLIGLYWTVHHRLFGFVINYTQRLLWINLLFLLGIVLLPFSTAFYSEYTFSFLKTPISIYSINFCYIGLMSFFMWRYVSNPKHNLSENLPASVANYYTFRAMAIPVIFAIIIIVSYFNPRYAIYIPPLTPVIMWLIGKYYKKKLVA